MAGTRCGARRATPPTCRFPACCTPGWSSRREAHARIASIDAEAAKAMPGVVDVLTAADLPVSPAAPGRAGEPLAREEVVFSGQPVAMVVAESEAAATDGVDAVLVDLEPLEAVIDLEAAMAPGAPRARTIERERATRRRRRRPRVGRRRRGRRARGGPLRQRRRPPAARATATPPPGSRAPTRPAPAASARRGSTRPTSSRRRRPPGSTSTARSSSTARRRARSPRARASPSCSTCRSTACACGPRRSAARSAAS